MVEVSPERMVNGKGQGSSPASDSRPFGRQAGLTAKLCLVLRPGLSLACIFRILSSHESEHGRSIVSGIVERCHQFRAGAYSCRPAFGNDGIGDPLYGIDFVHRHRRAHRDPIDGMGAFNDLRQLLMFEVAR